MAEMAMSERQVQYVTSVGTRVRDAREAIRPKLSQEKLAQRVGCSYTTINNLEKGRRMATLNTLEGVADVLEVSLSWILTGADSQNPLNGLGTVAA